MSSITEEEEEKKDEEVEWMDDDDMLATDKDKDKAGGPSAGKGSGPLPKNLDRATFLNPSLA